MHVHFWVQVKLPWRLVSCGSIVNAVWMFYEWKCSSEIPFLCLCLCLNGSIVLRCVCVFLVHLHRCWCSRMPLARSNCSWIPKMHLFPRPKIRCQQIIRNDENSVRKMHRNSENERENSRTLRMILNEVPQHIWYGDLIISKKEFFTLFTVSRMKVIKISTNYRCGRLIAFPAEVSSWIAALLIVYFHRNLKNLQSFPHTFVWIEIFFIFFFIAGNIFRGDFK